MTISLVTEFEPQILPVEAFPADGNRGFDMPFDTAWVANTCHHNESTASDLWKDATWSLHEPSPTFTILNSDNKDGINQDLRLRQQQPPLWTTMAAPENWTAIFSSPTTPILMVPGPDQSMPFNVITIVCTCMIFLYGTAFQGALRRVPMSMRDAYEGRRTIG
eukprot:CAMPEP_0113323992 /NCGR_PEP_ID=MMETSP0010_2-20120614/16730_1 /TAXON_ID=216773 ORGANISM="Corethron hystrix, Strain 308" /NCGR_SAMPLE_ID=MMETSP0010_2 /ASSEMBLY_ACC=CAM_ASM_000155 /LENGTH=162 /DNA_ID=CAMNT_0000183187 /DNA_START=331 /DNA_END=816 /DNA_ORIENTATION=- /assembly_acc=CAM_ASM_000155